MTPAPPIIVYDDLEKYKGTEGGAFGVVVGITLLLFIIFIVVVCIRQACCACCELPNRKLVHNLLSLIYVNLISINIRKDQNKDEEEVYLFGGKEFNYDENIWTSSNSSLNSNKSSSRTNCCNVCKVCCHCWTYAYFLIMALIAILWLITITIENAVYRKTGTCNDINVLDNRFTCFNLENKQVVNCSTKEARSLDTNVFCYLLSINPSAVGIGFSLFGLIIFITTTAFKGTIKTAEYGKCCCKWTLLIIQVLVALAVTIATISTPPSIHYGSNLTFYFFYGDAAMRWAMYFLLIITVSCGLLVPWCGFTSKDKYKDVTGKKEKTQQGNGR